MSHPTAQCSAAFSSAPASITATGRTPQSTTVGAAFAVALQTKVTDANSNPLIGVQVTFTAPASGPSASFNVRLVPRLAPSGVATAPAFTANGQAGSYTGSGGCFRPGGHSQFPDYAFRVHLQSRNLSAFPQAGYWILDMNRTGILDGGSIGDAGFSLGNWSLTPVLLC